jgi:hypothetical protein
LQQDHRVVNALEQVMVKADFAELVDQDGAVGKRRIAQQPLQERRLARAEKAGDRNDR